MMPRGRGGRGGAGGGDRLLASSPRLLASLVSIRWIVLILAGLGGLGFAWRTYPDAFSLVSLDLRMDRPEALHAAEQLALRHAWAPAPAPAVRAVAVFELDAATQTYVELEGGGQETYLRAIRDHSLVPYTWQVRRFAPGEAGETWVRFTPEGTPHGFEEHVPEDAPGPSWPRDSARALAERAASKEWAVDFRDYEPVEAAFEARPSGRGDHTFVYQRRVQPFGEGRLRLRLVVSGDRLTELTRYLETPEAFTRRYQHMRSANDAVASGAFGATIVLYGLLGIGVGLAVMLRRRRLIWRAPLVVGLGFGVLAAAALANALPLTWAAYDTATSAGTFRAIQLGLVLVTAGFTAILVGASAMAAETLGRAAFPRHPQLWRVWSRDAGASTAVAARTLGGYLLVGVFLGYMVGFWRVTRSWTGWWSPSDLLTQPNLFATYFPWLSPIAAAFQAGFLEECLFRAVPLAGAGLLGQRFGRRDLWIGAAFVVQALIFSAAHANYPSQPAYARVAELILPSFLFGALYLRFGLLPGVILHAGYDLSLLATPVFVATSPGIWGSRLMIVAAGLVPAVVVVWRRAQVGRWSALPDALRNQAWVAPPAPSPAVEAAPVARPEAASRLLRWIPAAGLAGLGAWALLSDWRPPPTPALPPGRRQVIETARAELAGRGVTLSAGWRATAEVRGGTTTSHEFVWRTAGDSVYRALLGDALPAPHWHVRFARFTGDLAERAEEWQVEVGGGNAVTHVVPEGRPGPALDEAGARARADSALGRAFEPAARARLVAQQSERRPARTDWTVTYADTSWHLPQGEVRLEARLIGDEVGAVRRYVHVPEQWERDWDRRNTIRAMPALAVGLLYFVLLIGALFAGGARLARGAGQADRRVVVVLAAGLGGLGLLGLANQWPVTIAGFETSKPYHLQVWTAIAAGGLAALLYPAMLAVVAGATCPRSDAAGSALRTGLPLGGVLVGVTALLAALDRPAPAPAVGPLDAWVPLLARAADPVESFVLRLVALTLPLFVGRWLARQRPALERPWYLLAGGAGTLVAMGASFQAQALAWGAGVAVLFLARAVHRDAGTLGLAVAVAAWVLAAEAREAWRQGPTAWLGLLIGAALLAVLVRAAWRAPPPAAPRRDLSGMATGSDSPTR